MRVFRTLIFCYFLIPSVCYAQKGPGGVGSTDGSSNLSLWLDASTISGIISGFNFSGSWLDQSGNGNHATILDNAPTYSSTNGGNNMPALTFDASNQESLVVTGNTDVLPTSEITVFALGNYEDISDSRGGMLFTSDDANWNDGWGIAEQVNSGEFNLWVDHYRNSGCEQNISDNYGLDQLWTLIFNTTDNLTYGYKNENTPCTDAFNGPINYDTGGNENLLIGKTVNPTYMEGDISEIIVYDVAVNNAQRIIISNYLAAKYNLTLENYDLYDEDNSGDYDFDVAGIGQASDGSNHTSAQGTGIISMSNPRNLDNGEFLIWGHDNGSLLADETSDISIATSARLSRVWRVSERDETNSSDVNVGGIDMTWDLSGLGLLISSEDDLQLLIDTDNDGVFSDETPIEGAVSLGGDLYQFENVPDGLTGLSNDRRFTLGISSGITLPVELNYFTAHKTENKEVQIHWETLSEINNESFTIERSKNSAKWEDIAVIPGAGNSIDKLFYKFTDETPLELTSYYRLKQLDYDGSITYSNIVKVTFDSNSEIILWPNPVSDQLTIEINSLDNERFRIINSLGQDVSHSIESTNEKNKIILNVSPLKEGLYFLQSNSKFTKFFKK